MQQSIPDMYPNYAKILLDDYQFQKLKLKKLEEKLIHTDGPVKFISNQIMKTILQIEDIEQEIDQIIRLAFFPYHDVPILKLLTNERYHQGPSPGAYLPPGDC